MVDDRMLTIQAFIQKITNDFKKAFPQVSIEKDSICFGSGVIHVEIPIGSMYREYQITDYPKTKESYIKIGNEILNQYKFKVDYSNVYPILKHRDFDKNAKV
jgi:hypothetical protein